MKSKEMRPSSFVPVVIASSIGRIGLIIGELRAQGIGGEPEEIFLSFPG
jgi:hypothetical protein